VGSSFRLPDFVCSGVIEGMERVIFPADIPSLLVHNLDRYPPESEHEEDQTCEYGGEEAFHDSYERYNLARRLEPGSLRRVGRQTYQQN